MAETSALWVLVENWQHQAEAAGTIQQSLTRAACAADLAAVLGGDPPPVGPLPDDVPSGGSEEALYRALVRGGYDPEHAECVVDDLRTFRRLRRGA